MTRSGLRGCVYTCSVRESGFSFAVSYVCEVDQSRENWRVRFYDGRDGNGAKYSM